jgi:3-hydroxybutyryl-CoA dehydrogenase
LGDEIRQIAIVGGGQMGQGIAIVFACAGFSVNVVDQTHEILATSLQQIGQSLQLLVDFELLTEKPQVVTARINKFLSTDMGDAVAGSKLVIECIPEILAQKKELFARLDDCSSTTIIASNTSSFTLSALTEQMRTPGRVVGTHFFMPAHIIPLVEVHLSQFTLPETISRIQEILLKVGKKPVFIRKEIPGFVVNRIQAAIAREAGYLLDQGVVTAEDFDLAARASYGFRLANLGPLAQADVNGLDTIARGNKQIYKSLCNADEPARSLLEKVENGDFGLKSGKGYYDYSGRDRSAIMHKIEENLLKQLRLFREREEG